MAHIIQKRFAGASKKPRLSYDFATKLLEKEAELERDCNVDLIQELVKLYTEAVEYYSYIKDDKYYDFQDRMHKMFVRPDVILALQHNTHPSPDKKSISMEERKIESEKSKILQSTQITSTLELQSSKNLNRVMNYQQLRNIEVARKAVLDFKSQDQDLEKRLNSRKKSMLTKSMDGYSKYMNTSMRNDKTLGAISEESNSPNNSFLKLVEEEEENNELEDELEKIMEKYCLEKAKRIADVQVRYETQLAEIVGEGGIMEQVRQQVRKDMQNELFEINKEIESNKIDEIRKLKSRHNRNSLSLS